MIAIAMRVNRRWGVGMAHSLFSLPGVRVLQKRADRGEAVVAPDADGGATINACDYISVSAGETAFPNGGDERAQPSLV